MPFDSSLDDITVLEIGSTLVGPYATQALGAMGANVIKVEPPGGDPLRGSTLPGSEVGISNYFAMTNCGKRSISLDLKADAGHEALLALAADADVVVENFRPGVVDRLGVGYDDLSAVSEDLIYCSVSGYGQEAPFREYPAIDPILQGMTGLMSVTGERGGDPVRIGVAVVDLMSALWTVVAIQSALRVRDAGGGGQYIDMSMYDVGVSMLTKRAGEYFASGEDPEPMGTEDSWTAPYGGYRTADDETVIIGTAYQAMWERLCELVEREDLLADDRFATPTDRLNNRDELNEILESVFVERTRDEWIDLLRGEIPVGPVLSVSETLESEQAVHNGVRATVAHDTYGEVDVLNLPLRANGSRHEFEVPPPEVGEHSAELLRECGYDDDRIDELVKAGVIPSPRR